MSSAKRRLFGKCCYRAESRRYQSSAGSEANVEIKIASDAKSHRQVRVLKLHLKQNFFLLKKYRKFPTNFQFPKKEKGFILGATKNSNLSV